MNLETLESFEKREQLIKLIKDDTERNNQLELLHKEKDTEYKQCWIKTTNRIKNSEQLLERLQISVGEVANDIKSLTLIVKEKGTKYDDFINTANIQKERFIGMKQLMGILKYILSFGGGAVLLKIIQNWPW